MPTSTRTKSIRKTTSKPTSRTRKKTVTKSTTLSRKRSSAVKKARLSSKTARQPLHKTVIHHIKRLGAKGFINKKFLIFLVGFMIIGGGYLAYRSFAYTNLVQADGEFTALAPARILDTRTTLGGINHAVGQTPVAVQVTGQGGIPVSGVKAVVMNVTVTGATNGGFLTVWPSGTTRPNTSNLNFGAGQTIANQVTVPVGADGKVLLYDNIGTTHVIFDVAGYFTDQTGVRGTRLNSVNPVRVLDTRTTTGGINAPIGQAPATLQITGKNGIPLTNVSAIVATVTVTGSTANSNLTLWPSGTTKPNTSNLNFGTGQTIANTVTLQLGADGKINISSSSGTTHVIIDITGFYSTPSEGFLATQQGRFVPLNPSRIFDTRTGLGGYNRPLGQGGTYSAQISGMNDIPGSSDVDSVVLNVAVTNGTAPSFLTAYPSNTFRPTTSSINFSAGQTIPNQVVVKVGNDGKVNLYNNSGNVDVIVDVAGYYIKEDDVVYASQNPWIGRTQNYQAKQVDYDFTVSSLTSTAQIVYPQNLPITDNATTFYGSVLSWSYNASGPNSNYLNFTCYKGKICEVTAPNSTSATDGQGNKTYTIPYPISAGTQYHITNQLLSNSPAHSGVWEKITISSNGVQTPVAMTYIGPSSTAYRYYGIGNPSYTINNSCKSPQAFSTTIANIKFDGDIVQFNQSKQLFSPFPVSTPRCPGFANQVYKPAPDGSLILIDNFGISSVDRDTTPPQITSLAINNGMVTISSTDNKAIANYSLSVDNTVFTTSYNVPSLGLYGLANSLSTNSYLPPNLTPGPHTVTATVSDNSGNVTSKSITVNL